MSLPEKSAGSRTLIGWLILIVPLLLMFLIFVNPIIHNFVLSFSKVNIMRGAEFVGLDNYRRLFENEQFGVAVANTLFSPALLLRILLLAAVPLALSLLFMHLRSGARIGLQVLLCPLILFSGAVAVSILYYNYYNPHWGLAAQLFPAPDGGPSVHLGNPEQAVGIVGNLLLANGLAYTVPLGIAFFLAAARGARGLGAEDGFSFGRFWERAWRLVLVFTVGAVGFSLSGLEGAFSLETPLDKSGNLITYIFRRSLVNFDLGLGGAAAQFIVLPLLLVGLFFILFAEGSKSSISIRIVPRLKESVTAGARTGGARIVVTIVSAALASVFAVVMAAIVVLPWLGSVIGLGELGGPGQMGGGALSEAVPRFFGSLGISLLTAVLAAALAWVVTAAAGFALGWLRPKGGKAALIVIGLFTFMSPALFLIPYYLTFRGLGLVDSQLALLFPCLLSPLGVLLFTWFFRGARDEEANGAPSGRTWNAFFLFSLPVLAISMLNYLNLTMLPVTMMMKPESFPVSLFIRLSLHQNIGMGGFLSGLAQLSFLQYVVPLTLLIVCAIAVFPRLALIVRRKGEEVQANEAGGIAGRTE